MIVSSTVERDQTILVRIDGCERLCDGRLVIAGFRMVRTELGQSDVAILVLDRSWQTTRVCACV